MSGKKYFHHQNWIAERYSLNAGFVPELGQPVVDLLKPQTGELILDLGCGEGTLTEKLLEFATSVIGVDNSLNQIEAAKKKDFLYVLQMGILCHFKRILMEFLVMLLCIGCPVILMLFS